MGDYVRKLGIAFIVLASACSASNASPSKVIQLVPADMLNPAIVTRYQGINAVQYRQTICSSGYTATIRPPENITNKLKGKQVNRGYNYPDKNLRNYEEDHVISLELGGNPTNPVNLFPEPHQFSVPDDKLENDLHKQVCAGDISLADAQSQILQAKVAHGYVREKSLV